jgi:hypothetical protein
MIVTSNRLTLAPTPLSSPTPDRPARGITPATGKWATTAPKSGSHDPTAPTSNRRPRFTTYNGTRSHDESPRVCHMVMVGASGTLDLVSERNWRAQVRYSLLHDCPRGIARCLWGRR